MSELTKGIIIKGLGGLYDIKLSDGSIVSCKAKGAFRHERITPYAGDNVILKMDDKGVVIEEITDRKNSLIRPPVANLDILFTVIAAAKPSPMLPITDKLISIAEFNKIEPVIIISKCDIDSIEADRIASIYKRSGFTVFVSGIDTDKYELLDFVTQKANGKISAFAGASGVGKSTVMNALFPKLGLETGDVSRKTERGKHTTRHVELFGLDYLTDNKELSGYVADTPGFSLIDFTRFDFYKKDDLVFTFREFEDYLGTCKYTKCSHTSEDGCKIIEAVKNGNIPIERHQSYVEIYNTLKNKHDWD
ncbi:MAG: ribosome small subunit-dependent GTPase A [Ruminococcaceae bacterium]|nr:ribosome small subunit-dependent GTPase A [Oscillospiraceae bacterium]